MTNAPAARLRDRLRVSPNFALKFSFDGRPFVVKDSEPYAEYWLTERDRLVHGLFASRRGASVGRVIDLYLRLNAVEDRAAEQSRLLRAVDDLRDGGVLVGIDDDPSRYDARMADAYLAHRPFPPEIAQHVIDAASIRRDSRVLDLAGGPGDLATQLARASDRVTLMELSKGFIEAAHATAFARGVALQTVQDSCNRLAHRDDGFDVITVAQALHWLDDVAVCRGVCRALEPDGSFFVIHSAITMDDAHPLAYLLGDRSVLGPRERKPFIDEVRPLWRRLGLLFEALDAPHVSRMDRTQRPGVVPIVPAGVAWFRQTRTIGVGFARAFLSDRHVDGTGLSPARLWADVEERCRHASPARLTASLDWAVLHFRRQPRAIDDAALDATPMRPIDGDATPPH